MIFTHNNPARPPISYRGIISGNLSSFEDPKTPYLGNKRSLSMNACGGAQIDSPSPKNYRPQPLAECQRDNIEQEIDQEKKLRSRERRRRVILVSGSCESWVWAVLLAYHLDVGIMLERGWSDLLNVGIGNTDSEISIYLLISELRNPKVLRVDPRCCTLPRGIVNNPRQPTPVQPGYLVNKRGLEVV